MQFPSKNIIRHLKYSRFVRLSISLLLLLLAPLLWQGHLMAALVNTPKTYPVDTKLYSVRCLVDVAKILNRIDPLVYGTNLEWFNNAGGIIGVDGTLNGQLMNLAATQGNTVYRFPGGTLSDYYHWRDGIGPISTRKVISHPTDSGKSLSLFGTPEFGRFLAATGGKGLITVNAGTGTAAEAADWVNYANKASNVQRISDGFPNPLGIQLWEVGNELYLPGNPNDVQKITVTPEVYASRFVEFAQAMRAVDPSIKLLALGADRSHVGPWSEYTNWTETVLKAAADKIDYISVHNAYFPTLYTERQPPVETVYPALMAAPEAVDKSLTNLEALIARYEKTRPINIAITEWGTLFTLPRVDPYWVDHVKTQGSGVYIARLLQVYLSHPKVKLTNYFKFVDQSYMGWINYAGKPKVPYWTYALFARYMRGDIVYTDVGSQLFSTPQVGGVPSTSGIKELTAVAAVNQVDKKLRISLVNRSLTRKYDVNLQLSNFSPSGKVVVRKVVAPEITSHNGRDVPPGYGGYSTDFEPYSSTPSDSISIQEQAWNIKQSIPIQPFSVVIVEIDGSAVTSVKR